MEAPTWFIVLGTIALVAYLLYRMFIGGPLANMKDLIKGKQGGCGCLFGIISGIIVGGILIWFIISELL